MMARNAAHALPTMRHASTRAIQDVARMLREAYEIGRAEAYAAGYVAGSTERDKKLPEGDA
jgi:hypothetical protein